MCTHVGTWGASVCAIALQTPKAADAVRQFGKHLSIDATFDAVETADGQPADQMFTVHVVNTANHAEPVCSFYGDDKKAVVSGYVSGDDGEAFCVATAFPAWHPSPPPPNSPRPQQTIQAALRVFDEYASGVLGKEYCPEVVMMVRTLADVKSTWAVRTVELLRVFVACMPMLSHRMTPQKNAWLLRVCGQLQGVHCAAGTCFATWRPSTTA
jgi:hypothetical protein